MTPNESYKKSYDIVYNNDILGKIFTNNGNLKIEIKPRNQIDIIKLFKSKIYQMPNNKSFWLLKELELLLIFLYNFCYKNNFYLIIL